jgi:hypothetical protein
VDHVDQEVLRTLLRVALRTTGGDSAAALRLVVGLAERDPTVAAALEASLDAAAWARLVREELVAHPGSRGVRSSDPRLGASG